MLPFVVIKPNGAQFNVKQTKATNGYIGIGVAQKTSYIIQTYVYIRIDIAIAIAIAIDIDT